MIAGRTNTRSPTSYLCFFGWISQSGISFTSCLLVVMYARQTVISRLPQNLKPICSQRPGLWGSRQMIAGERFHRPFYLCVVLTSAAPIACVCGWAEVSLSVCVSSLYGCRPVFRTVMVYRSAGLVRRPRAWVPQLGANSFVSAACIFNFQGAYVIRFPFSKSTFYWSFLLV